MAIDYVIDYDCVPKQTLGTMGILERLKSQERADTIIELYRRSGDDRSPTEMGFEMVRTAADGSEETQVVVVQHLLDYAADLQPLAGYCDSCPANRTGGPFGCMGKISYPLSPFGEAWLLNQLPDPPSAPLIWMLLRQGIREFNYDGSKVRVLREAGDTIFSESRTIQRALGELTVNSDQVFEMTFMLGNIQPNHGGILLLFLGALDRDIDADDIMRIGALPLAEREALDFLITVGADDDQTTHEIKQFVYALYLAWQLNVQLLLDV
jgi:hypothetical protein